MKRLPIGKQEIRSLIEGNYVYVDKTQYIYQMIDNPTSYFLSRPRRFGKSLLVSTLREIFSGNKELFRGLWIYDKIEWKTYPVIHLDFSKSGHRAIGTINSLNIMLDECAKSYGVTLEHTAHPLRFKELIEKVSVNGKVVILIDEYDKSIIDYIDQIDKAIANREILKDFLSILKGSEKYIHFLFITGVSKFSQVSIFSDLNHLNDITVNPKYAQIVGYTEAELLHYFKDYIELLHKNTKDTFPDILQTIKEWYDGYSWDGATFVYNPFSVLNLFENMVFSDYWFATGTPTFLVKMLHEKKYSVFDLEKKIVNQNLFDKYELTDIDINALLFQTGYLTIKEKNLLRNTFTLDFPNKEVENSFTQHLLATFTEKTINTNTNLLFDLEQALVENDIAEFIENMKILFANITYPNIDNKEKYYHSIFYMALKLIGYNIESEIHTNRGKIDALLQTKDYLYVIEFKVGKAQEAMQQIKKKQYYQKYLNCGKTIVLLGIGFDTAVKNIGEYEIEVFK